ncbi:nucleoside hydrolase [Diplocloster hominis]|uniref:nucleoside hydrolase n=1 Tax=Diplocloster hominis TaxID=3079010 RepID=UPI0031BB63C9
MIYDEYDYKIPEGKRIRLIIDSDVKNEADDPFAIIHALLSPKFDNRGIVAAHFGDVRSPHSMQDSYTEAKHILQLMGLPADLAFPGAKEPLTQRDGQLISDGALAAPGQGAPSEGARFIIEEALREDTNEPLYVVCMGPLTDVALAWICEPSIAQKLTCIWIGGGAYPFGGFEYNLSNDILAARIVMHSDLPLWQIPRDVYSEVLVSMAELQYKVKGCGILGAYLFEQLEQCSHTSASMATNRTGEFWCLGDSPGIGVLLADQLFGYEIRRAPGIRSVMTYADGPDNREIKVYQRVNSRYILEDFFAKLALYAQRQGTK